MKKTVVILSGGIDSTTALYLACTRGDKVFALSFDYGQRHKKELEAAKMTCRKLSIDHKIVSIPFMTDIASNSSLTSTQEIPEGHYEDENMKQTVVPNRNMILTSIAIAYAVNIQANSVVLGIHGGDHAIYPDCRPEFLEGMNVLGTVSNYHPVAVEAPFITQNKVDIIRKGIEMNVDYSLTWTCYNGREKACGKCGSCVERIEAFGKNNIIDPIQYE